MERLGFRLTLGGIGLVAVCSILIMLLSPSIKNQDIQWSVFGWAVTILLPSILCLLSLWLSKQHPLVGGTFLILLGFGCLLTFGIPVLATTVSHYTSEFLLWIIPYAIIFVGGPGLVMWGGWLIFDDNWNKEPT